jgi:phosphorylcholine metabolism protein LicD
MIIMNKVILILLIVIIITLIVLKTLKYNFNRSKKYFTKYDGFEYSDKLSIKDIKNLKKGQKIMTNMLREFNRICRKHNLKYWCIGGTLIGALRHNGWVPWDGDVDIGMLKEDYIKLNDLLKNELPKDMWFQDKNNDKYYKSDIGKIRDLNSCYIEYTNNGGIQWHNGLQIDIFVFKHEKNMLITNFTLGDVENMKYNMIFPLKEAMFEDLKVYIPNKYKEYCIKYWGEFPPLLYPVNERLPHEGKIDANKTCDFHLKKYPNLYK